MTYPTREEVARALAKLRGHNDLEHPVWLNDDQKHVPIWHLYVAGADAILALFPSPTPLDDGVRERVKAKVAFADEVGSDAIDNVRASDLRTLLAAVQGVGPRELAARQDRLRDSEYAAGLRAGWNFAQNGDGDSLNAAIEARIVGHRAAIDEARQADDADALAAVQGAGEPTLGERRRHELIERAVSDVTASLKARVEELEGLALALADAADTVGIAYFDTDDMAPDVEAMQAATVALRAALQSNTPAGAK